MKTYKIFEADENGKVTELEMDDSSSFNEVMYKLKAQNRDILVKNYAGINTEYIKAELGVISHPNEITRCFQIFTSVLDYTNEKHVTSTFSYTVVKVS